MYRPHLFENNSVLQAITFIKMYSHKKHLFENFFVLCLNTLQDANQCFQYFYFNKMRGIT